jgi:hypothetical protein
VELVVFRAIPHPGRTGAAVVDRRARRGVQHNAVYCR